MSSVININSLTSDPLGRFLSYYDTTPKMAPGGESFRMYSGYYYYCITAGDNTRFLRAKSRDDLAAKSKFVWNNVPSLQTMLESTLSLNINNSPLAYRLVVTTDHPVVWEEPDRSLSNHEKRWLRVVQNTVSRIRSNHS